MSIKKNLYILLPVLLSAGSLFAQTDSLEVKPKKYRFYIGSGICSTTEYYMFTPYDVNTAYNDRLLFINAKPGIIIRKRIIMGFEFHTYRYRFKDKNERAFYTSHFARVYYRKIPDFPNYNLFTEVSNIRGSDAITAKQVGLGINKKIYKQLSAEFLVRYVYYKFTNNIDLPNGTFYIKEEKFRSIYFDMGFNYIF